MTRVIVETTHRDRVVLEFGRLVRYEIRVGDRVVAGRQFRLSRILSAVILSVAAFVLISALPPIPVTAERQPDAYVRVFPVPQPAVPSVAALTFSTYEVGEGETLARIAYANRVSVATLAALNPGVVVEAEVELRLPRPGQEVVVYTATGGERLSDLADFWCQSRVATLYGEGPTVTEAALLAKTRDYAAFLAPGSALHPVTLAGLVEDNAIPADRPLAAGQTVYVRLTRPPSEVHVKLSDGSWLYYGANMGLPVVGVLSQSYGGSSGQHRGVDIAAPLDASIVAPRSGVVLWAGWDEAEDAMGVHAHLVHEWSPEALAYIRDRFGVDDYAALGDDDRRECLAGLQAMRTEGVRVSMLESVYGHIGGLAFGVSEGSIVAAGARLARVGDNGRSTGSHLHLAVLVSEVSVPPMWFVVGGR